MDHSSHIWWSPHTWRLTYCIRDAPWDNLIRKLSYKKRSYHIVHLSQKENNPGFSTFKIVSKCGFSFFPQGISKKFYFSNDETSSYLLNGIILYLLLWMWMWLLLMVWISATNVIVPVGLNEKFPIELKSYFGIR